MDIDKKITEMLLEQAKKARNNARARYSAFKVGASVLTGSGRIYCGCNVESSSFGLSMCAERNCLSAALCSGEQSFEAIMIVADTPEPVSPCGACRQLIYDYAPGITVIMSNLNGDIITEKITDLLKRPFGFEKK